MNQLDIILANVMIRKNYYDWIITFFFYDVLIWLSNRKFDMIKIKIKEKMTCRVLLGAADVDPGGSAAASGAADGPVDDKIEY